MTATELPSIGALVRAGALRRGFLVGALGLVGALLIASGAPLCPSAALLGVPCPGCGLTRATLALLAGDWRVALGFHPLVVLLAPLTLALIAAAATGYVLGPHAPKRPAWMLPARAATALAWVLLALVIGVWAARFLGAFGGPAPVRPVWSVLAEQELKR